MSGYLRIRNGIYHFRRKVPKNLIELFGSQEIIKSTGTGDKKIARRKARLFLVETDELFDLGKIGNFMNKREYERLARRLFLIWKSSLENGLANPPKGLDVHRQSLSRLLEITKEGLRENKSEMEDIRVQELLKSEGIVFEKGSLDYLQFNRYASRAVIASLENAQANFEGDYGYQPKDRLFSDEAFRQDEKKKNAVRKIKTDNFAVAAESYMNQELSENAINLKTAKHYRMTYREFVKLVGDKPFDEYTRIDIDRYIKTLTLLPNDWSKNRAYYGLSMEEISNLKKKETKDTLSKSTLSRHLRALSNFFNAQINRGAFLGTNPASKYRISTGAPAPKDRQPWPEIMLVDLFSSPVWAGAKSLQKKTIPGEVLIWDAFYWLPILALYHGNRLEEFAQLRLEDIKTDDGIVYFHIHDGGERRLKNRQSIRRVPLHPILTKLRFSQYCNSVAKISNDRIFPKLKPDSLEGKYGPSFTKKFTTYRQAIGVYKSGIDYHSFRHNVTTKLYECGVQEHLVDELTGHSQGSVSRKVYKHEMPIKQLYEAISIIEWPEVEKVLLKTVRSNI